MAASETFVLLHSPIVGPDTWEPVAQGLRAGGVAVVVPTLTDDGSRPFWRQHVTAAADGIDGQVPTDAALLVVAHSGAGQLTAQLGRELRTRGRTVAGYLFVDSGLPPDGSSRLDQLHDEAPRLAEELDATLQAGEPFPDWDDRQLRPLVPDDERRRRLIAGLRRLPMGYWTEPIPGAPGWDRVPVGVLLFGAGYPMTVSAAEERGWPMRQLHVNNHFHMLEQPTTVAAEIQQMARQVLQRSP